MSKKKEVPAEKPILGRPGNTLKMGIVGLPNVGKSTTYNVLSRLHVPAENYPFCTVEPNIAKVAIPDARFDTLVKMWKPKSQIAATLSVVDIAGLVPGASEGLGLGNHFLSHIQAVDGIYHVVRGFDDDDIIHTEGDVDPVRDLEIIYKELLLKDLQIMAKRVEEVDKNLKHSNDKELKDKKAIYDKIKACLDANKWIKDSDWNAAEIVVLNELSLITSKQVIYLVNISPADYASRKNKYLGKISAWVQSHCPGTLIPYSAAYEMDLLARGGTPDQGEPPSAVPKLIKQGYDMLRLIHFFTAGEDEVRCWTIQKGYKAPQAGAVIHTDFEKFFICAETMKYEDFVALGTETEVKNQGKLKTNGKEYVVEDGDILFFRSNKK